MHYIFSFIKYNEVLNLIKYNKNLQNKLNLELTDYSIDYKFNFIEEIIEKNVLNKTNVDGPPIIFYLNFSLKIIFCIIVLYNLINFRSNTYNILLIIGLIYISLSVFYIMTKIFFETKGDLGCLQCYYIIEKIILFYLL